MDPECIFEQTKELFMPTLRISRHISTFACRCTSQRCRVSIDEPFHCLMGKPLMRGHMVLKQQHLERFRYSFTGKLAQPHVKRSPELFRLSGNHFVLARRKSRCQP